MKRTVLFLLILCSFGRVFSQSVEAEKEFINAQIQAGKLNSEEVRDITKKLSNFSRKYKYPVLPFNKTTGEIDYSDIVFLTNLDKKAIFEKCLEWIVIGYGNILHKDPESGKIIASGNLSLKNSSINSATTGDNTGFQLNTSVNYMLILTVKDNKLKYQITNIEYTFYDVTGFLSDITLPINSLFPIILQDELQWKRYIAVLNESTNMFSFVLKDSLKEYIIKADEDNNF
jgi:hypothetical protein